MSILVQRFLSDIAPGDVIDVNVFEDMHGPQLKRELLDEIEGLGFVLDSRGTLGEVSMCDACEGEGHLSGRACGTCDGYSTVVDFGRGKKAFKS